MPGGRDNLHSYILRFGCVTCLPDLSVFHLNYDVGKCVTVDDKAKPLLWNVGTPFDHKFLYSNVNDAQRLSWYFDGFTVFADIS